MSDKELLSAIGEMIEGSVVPIKEDINQIKGEMAQLKGELAQLKGEMAQLKGEFSLLRGEVAQFRAEQENIKAAVLSNGDAISHLEKEFGNMVAVIKSNCFDIELLKTKVS